MVIFGKDDRRQRVSDDQLLTFPFNSIGLIRSRIKISNKNKYYDDIKTTGFLIAPSLVLTSSNYFSNRNEDNVIQYLPQTFSTLQPEKDGLVEKVVNIKSMKLNSQFMELQNKILMMKNMSSKEKDKIIKQKYQKQILDLYQKSIPHDFALLKLEQPIVKPHYFELYTSLDSYCELSVTGVNFYGDQISLFTHSNTFEQISNVGIYYNIDTTTGQAGCPVYVKANCCKVVGVHKGYDTLKRLNFATMITEQVIDVIKIWALQLNSLSATKIQEFKLKQQKQNANKRSIEYFDRALSMYKKVEKRSISQMDNPNEFENIQKIKFTQALLNYTNAVNIFKKIGKQSKEWAMALSGIGNVYDHQGNAQQALEYYKKAVAVFQRLQKESIGWGNTLKNIGVIYYEQGNKQQALLYYYKALKIYEKIGKKSIGWAHTLSHIGVLYENQEKSNYALEYYEKAVTFYQKIDKKSEYWAHTLNKIGSLYQNQGKNADSLKYYNRAQTIYQKIGKESIKWSDNLIKIGQMQGNLGKTNQALQYYNRALSIIETAKGEKSLECVVTLNAIASVYSNMGQPHKAFEYYSKALSIIDKVKGKYSFDCVAILNDIAYVSSNMGLLKEAIEYYNIALSIIERVKGKESPQIKSIYAKINQLKKQ